MKNILNNRLFIFLLGVILSGTVVYAGVFRAVDISYDNNEFKNIVNDHEEDPEGGERCHLCYDLRLEFYVKKGRRY